MRVILIEDVDAKALMDSLELTALKGSRPLGVEEIECWDNLPQNIKDSLIREIHRKFHYVVYNWLNKHGASAI